MAGDTKIGDRLTRQTVEKISALEPTEMLYWCPSCDNHLRSKGAEFETDLTRGRRSVLAFLAETLTPEHFVAELPFRVAFHAHAGTQEQDADIRDLRLILSRIPKLEIVELTDISGIGRHCSDGNVKTFGIEKHRGCLESWIEHAKKLGVDRIVSVYHSCHRHMIQYQIPAPVDERIPVENYLTLICRGLGLPLREDKYAKFSALNDVDQIFNELAERIDQSGVSKDAALRVIKSQFITER